MDEVLRIEGLHKRFGRGKHPVQANAGSDLQVNAGTVVGLLGHNGAGKSTLVNQVVGLLRPDSGRITLAGVDAIAHPEQARQLASVQAQANVPITGLTPTIAIALVGRLRGGERRAVQRRAKELIDALELQPWADTPAEKVSGGIARLTAFAMTAVAPAQLVVLDEPTNDVDPVRRRLLWAQIRALADAGSAVLLVTHNVREAESVVDQLAILDHGAVLASGSPAELAAAGAGHLSLELETVPDACLDWPAEVKVSQNTRTHVTLSVPTAEAPASIAWANIQRQRGLIERYTLAPRSLEDTYIELVEEETAA